MPGVRRADVSELLHQMLHARGVAVGHDRKYVSRCHIPGRRGQGQRDQARAQGGVAGIVNQGINDSVAVAGCLAENPVAQPVELHGAVSAAAEFVVYRGEGLFAAVHDIAPEVGNHAVEIGVGQGVVPPGAGEIEGQKAQKGGILINGLHKHAV